MRQVTSTLCLAALLALPGLAAGAETYTIRSGSLTDASTGRSRPLTGSFEASVFEPDPPDGATPVVLRFDDFELASGGRSLTPAAPIEFEGLLPAYLVIGDGVVLEDDRVSSLHLRAGGDLVGASDDEVTYRFFELRSDSPPQGSASGRLGDSGLPRTLRLEGTLYELEQSFAVSGPEDCAVTTPPPSPGGGGTSGGGGGGVIVSSGAVISFPRFEVPALETIAFVAPAGSASGGVVNRVSGDGGSLIEGELVSNDDLLNPPGIVFPLAPATVPTLEELGIRAPGGAQVSLVSGALLVDAAGDLLVEGDFPAIPGLTGVTLRAHGSIIVTGTIHVAPGVSIRLEAGGSVNIADGGLDLPEPAPTPPPVGLPRICNALIPTEVAERALGSVSLVASAAQPIAIDVEPRNARNRVDPGSKQVISVAILGSRELDVRDIDPGSLRLGPGEAEPLRRHGRPQLLRLRLDRDRYPDLVAFFALRQAEVAFGDTELCLAAETEDGVVLEGCDAIDARPPGLGGRRSR